MTHAIQRIAQIELCNLTKRNESKNETDDERNRDRKSKDPHIKRQLVRSRKYSRPKHAQQIDSPGSKHQTQHCAKHGEQRAFDCKLPHKTPTARTQSRP